MGGADLVCMDIEILKQWLKRYGEITHDLENLYNRYEALEQSSTSPRASKIDSIPHKNTFHSDRMGNILTILEELAATIQKHQEAAKKIYHEIDDIIHLLESFCCRRWANKKCVLQCRYLDLMNFQDIAELLFGNMQKYWDNPETYLRRTHKLHKEALEELAKLVPVDLIQEIETEKE